MFNLQINDQKVRLYFNRNKKKTVCTIITPEAKYEGEVKCYYNDSYNKHVGMIKAMEKTLKTTPFPKEIRKLFYQKFFSIILAYKLH